MMKLFIMTLLALPIGLSLGACSKSSRNRGASANATGEVLPGTPGSTPSTIVLQSDINCMDNPEFNACIFRKNPVAQTGDVLTNTTMSTQTASELQIYGVTLTSSDGVHLKNIDFEIIPVQGEPALGNNRNWKTPYQDDVSQKIGQVGTFFWLNYAASIARESAGVFWAHGQNLKIHVNDKFSGWSGKTNTIYLAQNPNGLNASLSGEIAVYFLGHANLHFASVGKSTDFSQDQNHSACANTNQPPLTRGCCSSNLGCGRAVAAGAAEYFVAMTFPEQPIIGEALANNPQGLSKCGLRRNLNEQKDLSATTAYSTCSEKNGDVDALGLVYASIWWEMRKKATTMEAAGARQIDRIYMNHLVQLTGADTFSSAYEKIITTEQGLFGGRYKALFRQEFLRRGISVP